MRCSNEHAMLGADQVHQGTILNDEQAETHLREAWEHESSKHEMNIVLQGLERTSGRERKLVG